MNKELEKLIDYAIVDGYITDQEKKVLIKKAQKQGFDVDELEMILEGKLYDSQQKRKKSNPVQKCPSCGEILNGVSRVCPSCNYILNATSENTVTLDEFMAEVEDNMVKLKNSPGKPPSGKILKSVILIYLTAGIYILYKKLIKKENLFVADYNYDKIVSETEGVLRLMKNTYGDDNKVSEYINKITAERDDLIKKRQTANLVPVIATFIIIGGLLYGFTQLPEPEPSDEKKITAFIEQGKLQDAKKLINGLDSESSKSFYLEEIEIKIIDSIFKTGNYSLAIERANMLNNKNDREEIINEVVKTEVNELIKKKDFKTAKQKIELAPDYWLQQELTEKIEVAEKLKK